MFFARFVNESSQSLHESSCYQTFSLVIRPYRKPYDASISTKRPCHKMIGSHIEGLYHISSSVSYPSNASEQSTPMTGTTSIYRVDQNSLCANGFRLTLMGQCLESTRTPDLASWWQYTSKSRFDTAKPKFALLQCFSPDINGPMSRDYPDARFGILVEVHQQE